MWNAWFLLEQHFTCAVHNAFLSLESAGGDVSYLLGCKTETYTHQSSEFMVNCEVAPAARPILSVDVNNSYIMLPDGHNNSMVLDGTWLDEPDLRNYTLVASVLPFERHQQLCQMETYSMVLDGTWLDEPDLQNYTLVVSVGTI